MSCCIRVSDVQHDGCASHQPERKQSRQGFHSHDRQRLFLQMTIIVQTRDAGSGAIVLSERRAAGSRDSTMAGLRKKSSNRVVLTRCLHTFQAQRDFPGRKELRGVRLLHVTKVIETKGLGPLRKMLLLCLERLKPDWSSRCLGKGEIYGFRDSGRRTYIASPCASRPEVQLKESRRAWKYISEGIANAR